MGDERELWVNTRFTGAGIAEFEAVQKHLGIKTRVEVVRYLVRQAAHEMRRGELKAAHAPTEVQD